MGRKLKGYRPNSYVASRKPLISDATQGKKGLSLEMTKIELWSNFGRRSNGLMSPDLFSSRVMGSVGKTRGR